MEHVKPRPVRPPHAKYPWIFKLRCLFDLQLGTIVKHLCPEIQKITGMILDVGAGQSPWRYWLSKETQYQGLDVYHANQYAMELVVKDVIYYDGTIMPFTDHTADHVLCIEVLEHTENPELLLQEIRRILKPTGKLFLTVPWSARGHHLPYDYCRFTREKLNHMLIESGFSNITIKERGNDIYAIANKLIILTWRLLRPQYSLDSLPKIILGILCTPITLFFLLLAYLSEYCALGAIEDPLGYYVTAMVSEAPAII
jgi:SAM-dependent methyltransferase